MLIIFLIYWVYSLRDRLKESEEKIEELLEQDRINQVELNNSTVEIKKLETKLSNERTIKIRLETEYESTKDLLEETKTFVKQILTLLHFLYNEIIIIPFFLL